MPDRGWRFMGSTMPGMGADRLTRLGRSLAWVLIGLSAVDAVTGVWLWIGYSRGRMAGLVTTPVTFGLAVLFQLPVLLVVAPLRALLLIVAPVTSMGRRQ